VLAFSDVGEASLISFTDRTAWLAAAGASTTIDFEGIALPGSFVYYPTPPGVSFSGVDFDAPATLLFVVDPAYDPAYDRGSGADLSWQNGVPPTLTAGLPLGVTAVGADFFSIIVDSSLLLTLNTGENFEISAPGFGNGMSFFGVTSTSTISSITISPAGVNDFFYALDNFSFNGPTVAAPEPSSLLLLGAGLVALVARSLRE
jgi:hypothetical protein